MNQSEEEQTNYPEEQINYPEEQDVEEASGTELEEEDLDLIKENTGISISSNSNLKRLRRVELENNNDRASEQINQNEEYLKGLFDDKEGFERDENVQEYDDEDDNEDDFIVDDLSEPDDQIDAKKYIKKEFRSKKISSESYEMAKALGFSRESWNLVYDLFGDGSDYSYALKSSNYENYDDDANDSKKDIKQVFEPSELESKFFTEKDQEIVASDYPERWPFKISENVSNTDELEQMSIFINSKQTVFSPSEQLVALILKIVLRIKSEILEVPTIFQYRLDYVVQQGVVDKEGNEDKILKFLWQIWDLMIEYESFISKKEKFVSIQNIEQSNNSDSDPMGFNNQDINGELHVSDLLDGITEPEELTDLTDLIMVRNPSLLLEKNNKFSGQKRPVKSSFYTTVVNSPVSQYMKHYGISSEHFGINLNSNFVQHAVVDPELSPTVCAKKYVSKDFPSERSVIMAGRKLMTMQIMTDLNVRNSLYTKCFEHDDNTTTITVLPTANGKDLIDSQHPYYEFKYISQKPVSCISNTDEYLKYMTILKAKEEGLVDLSIVVDKSRLVSEMKKFFLSDAVSELAEKWNVEREKILEGVVEDLEPKIVKRILEKLYRKSHECLCETIAMEFRKKLLVSPYKLNATEKKKFYYQPYPRVLALTLGGSTTNALFGLLVNDDGNVADFIKLNNFLSTSLDLKEVDKKSLESFIESKEIHVIAVAGWHVVNKSLFEEVKLMIERISTNYDDKDKPKIELLWARDDCARIFMNSELGKSEFPTYNPLMKYCVSLARAVQEPVHEYAMLFNKNSLNPYGDVQKLKLHDLQNQTTPELLYTSLEREMINAVCNIGADINRISSLTNGHLILQFVGGLGIRKAKWLIEKIRTLLGGVMYSRIDLVSECKMGKVVFMNCAGFVKLHYFPQKKRKFAVSDVLDVGRIHPEDYHNARKMVADALDHEMIPDDEENPSQHVEELWSSCGFLPSKILAKLDELNTSDFAEVLKRQQSVQKFWTLEMMKSELSRPYADRRRYFPMSLDEVFEMLTGESDKTLQLNMIVGALVMKVREKSVLVKLNNGLEGFISPKNVHDNVSASGGDPSSFVREGQTLKCKILAVNKERFNVELTAKKSSLDTGGLKDDRIRLDKYFDKDAQSRDVSKNSASGIIPETSGGRSVKHPLFHNFNYQQAESFLKDKQPGELVFRPSSRGTSYIALTWKLANNIYQHVDIEESQKDNEFALGRTLKIGNETFGDLDEIHANYVAPMARYVKDVMNNQKFVNREKKDLVQHVEREIMANPRRIPYVIGFSDVPGKFSLIYKVNVKEPPGFDNITVTSDGFKYRDEKYLDLTKVINAFKQFVSQTSTKSPNQHDRKNHPSSQSNQYRPLNSQQPIRNTGLPVRPPIPTYQPGFRYAPPQAVYAQPMYGYQQPLPPQGQGYHGGPMNPPMVRAPYGYGGYSQPPPRAPFNHMPPRR